MNATTKIALACAAICWLSLNVGSTCHAQNSPANSPTLSPDLQEVVALSQAHMGDDVIVTFIKSSGKPYKLGANEILYLNSQGVSQGVISALQTAATANPPTPPSFTSTQPSSAPVATASIPTAPTPAQPVPVQIIINQNTPSAPQPAPQMAQVPPVPPTEVPPQAGPEINFNYFHDQLAPFGTWVNVGGAMYWHPDQAIAANPDWRPYYDMGQWVQTDNGLYWQSDYTWGDIPFHYGRWVLDPFHGWLWAPDYTWGPAWVFWRHAEGDAAIGWAPLPMGAVFVDGVFMFNGVRVGMDFDFGLGESCFVFAGYDHFHEGFFRMRGHEWGYHIGHERLHAFYGRSVIRNEFRRDEHGRFVNNGIGRDRIEHLTHVEHSGFEERHPVGDRNQLAKQRMDHPENVGHSGNLNNGSHLPGGNTGHPGTGNVGHPSDVNAGSHLPGGNAGQAQHQGSGQPAVSQNNTVSKVFRPPTQAANPGTIQRSNSGTQQAGGGQQKKKQ